MCGYEFQSVNMQMLCTVFACMTWPDSTVCHKATRLAMSFIREVCAETVNSVNCSFPVLEALQLTMVDEKRLWDTDIMQRIIVFNLRSLLFFSKTLPPLRQCRNSEKLQAPVLVIAGEVGRGAVQVTLYSGAVVCLACVKKRQKYKFVPRLLSMFVVIV